MYTDIRLEKLKCFAEELSVCEKNIRMERMKMEGVCRNLRTMDSDAMRAVCEKLRKQTEGLGREEQKIKMIRTALLKIVTLYENCEEKILNLENKRSNDNRGEFTAINLVKYLEPMNLLNLRFSFQAVKGGKE